MKRGEGGWSALVLAGQRVGGDGLARQQGVAHKALIAIENRTLIEHVMAALAAVPAIGSIVISAAESAPFASLPAIAALINEGRVRFLASGPSPSGSVAHALAATGTPLIVTTADHALLTPAALERFLARAEDEETDVAAALIPFECVRAAFPGQRRTRWRFSDGDYAGGNLFAFLTPAGTGVVRIWQRLEEDRKRPWRIVRRFGWGLLLRYALGRLSLARALDALAGRAGCRIGAIALEDPTLAVDVDTGEDLAWARRLMAQRTAESASAPSLHEATID